MRTLSLLRHAKSSWDDPIQRDFDRPLNPRGRQAAQRMGAHLREAGLTFDRVLASPALRVVETLAFFEEAFGRPLGALLDHRIYMASASALLDLVRATEDVPHLLIVGHNPGLEELALMLTSPDTGPLRQAMATKFPTAAFASIDFAVGRLADIREGEGQLRRFVRPRDLDPTLGPDER
ncbi:MAG: histidine phosphatase family protein [Sphingomonadaceae bacterium]|uniref:SixA phosphatase family protein n=1 Tax=Thermaurantiacus sp. TaxID=2820283 RepID=UPI00298F0833|nr:histidine phosphatase family protein [Thermaurantiacus sp.]MCS6987065.1 histidine phosphatase family protein [Sphingomonadaceae bacterium]MDW8415597.1 histidine phosphatase family protein [Thermaurantiacus sp.]